MSRKKIGIFVKNRTILKFLENFFKRSKIYDVNYSMTPRTFLKYISDNEPSVLITETTHLQSVSDKITRFPSIVFIPGDIKKGVAKAVSHNAKNYIYRPYLKEDLEFRLEDLILEKETLESMKNEIRELEIITQLTRLISSTLDPKEILFRIVRQIAEVMPVTRCSIIRVDWLHKNAFVVATFEDPNITGIKLSLVKYPEIMKALTSKKPVLIKDVETDQLMQKVRKIISPLGIRSILVIPVILNKKVIGTLFLRTSRKGHAFTGNEIRVLNAIADASANSLYNAFLFEQVEDEKTRLEKLAVTDYLTGIYNIRYFYHRIIEEFSRCQRYAYPISCLMLDIDHFKRVNDIYGHKTGDMTLREFAQVLNKHSRKSDVLARYGGEEFIILLPQTSLEGALMEAERIRTIINDHSFRSLKKKSSLTVSIGISSYPLMKIKTHDELITFSDNALFTAKERGRNQVVIYGQEQ